METKSIKIQVPDGMEIDKEKSTFEEIVFKPIDNKPRSWEEFCKNYPVTDNEYFIQSNSEIDTSTYSRYKRGDNSDRNLLPSKEYAEAFLALMQLISLRQAWIGEWKPDYTNRCAIITTDCGRDTIGESIYNPGPLSFPTSQMASEFRSCFRDLLEKAKILL